MICYREKEVIGMPETRYWIKDKVALNDSQVAVFFCDDYKIKTGSESPLTSRIHGDDETFITVTPAQAGVQNI